MSASGSRTVVNAGVTSRAIGMSSKPMMLTCSGTATPRSRNTASAPTAMESFSAAIAVSPGSASSSCRVAVTPLSRSNSPYAMRRPGRDRPYSRAARRSPAIRSVVVVSRFGPASTPIRLWPSSYSSRPCRYPPISLAGSTASTGCSCRPIAATRPPVRSYA